MTRRDGCALLRVALSAEGGFGAAIWLDNATRVGGQLAPQLQSFTAERGLGTLSRIGSNESAIAISRFRLIGSNRFHQGNIRIRF